MNKIIVLNGPNLNLLGEREKKQYGTVTLEEIEKNCKNYASKNNIDLSFFQSNIHLVENIKLFTEINKQIFNSVINKLKSNETIDIEKLNFDKQLLDKINKFAPIKHILKNKPKNDNQVIELLDDISDFDNPS